MTVLNHLYLRKLPYIRTSFAGFGVSPERALYLTLLVFLVDICLSCSNKTQVKHYNELVIYNKKPPCKSKLHVHLQLYMLKNIFNPLQYSGYTMNHLAVNAVITVHF